MSRPNNLYNQRARPAYRFGRGFFEQGLYGPRADPYLLGEIGSQFTIGDDGVSEQSFGNNRYDYGQFPGQLY